jgi:hypothetical protein
MAQTDVSVGKNVEIFFRLKLTPLKNNHIEPHRLGVASEPTSSQKVNKICLQKTQK